MNIHPDFKDLLQLLEEREVEYMIVGGYAVAYHGYPRFTKDIDVFYDASDENVRRLRDALIAFGFGEDELPHDIFTAKGNVLTFGIAPSRVDFINDIDGVTFKVARPNAVRGKYGDVEVTFIGFDDLIQNKRSTQRAKDKADIEELTRDDTMDN